MEKMQQQHLNVGLFFLNAKEGTSNVKNESPEKDSNEKYILYDMMQEDKSVMRLSLS
jgi:hypothetical protein